MSGFASLPGSGVSPGTNFPSPKIEDPPQEEWGIRGLKTDFSDSLSRLHVWWIPCQAQNDVFAAIARTLH